MKIEVIQHGFIDRRRFDSESSPRVFLSRPRIAAAEDGTLVCVYSSQSQIGANDRVPMTARSRDGGKSWRDEGAIFPRLIGKFSFDLALGKNHGGELMLFGTRLATEASAQTPRRELIWVKSNDHGKSWTNPAPIALPSELSGELETDGPMVLTRIGTWIAPCTVRRLDERANQPGQAHAAALVSRDRGRVWNHTPMLPAKGNPTTLGGWACELSDGRVLATGTTLHAGTASHVYAISRDGGVSWSSARATGTRGGDAAITALPGACALLTFIQHGDPDAGLTASLAQPTDKDFGSRAAMPLFAPPPGGSLADATATALKNDEAIICFRSTSQAESSILTVRVRVTR